jgi:alanine racemase
VESLRAWAEIDLDALAHNLWVIRRRAGHNRRVMLVVKADAYGHGAVPIARHAVRCGIAALGVGTSAEALELRQAGIEVPILVLGTVVDAELQDCLRHDVHIGLHSSDRRASRQALAEGMGVVARVHLNVDTGMGRLGVLPARALDLLREIRASDHLELAGVMTHVSAPEGLVARSTREQLARFEQVVAGARAERLLNGWIHVANSAALFTGIDRYDTVRPGIAAYGALARELPGALELRQVMTLRSQVVFLKDVPAGTPVGYASMWHAPRRTRIATLPLGYNDGVPWRPTGVGAVLLRGQRAPIVGRVSMDYTTIDVGHIPNVQVGDEATLFGSDGQQSLSLEEVARNNDTIPYQLTCSIGKRVARRYRGGAELLLADQSPRNPSGKSPDREASRDAQRWPERAVE